MWLVPRSARLNVVGVEPKGSKCNLKNLECYRVEMEILLFSSEQITYDFSPEALPTVLSLPLLFTSGLKVYEAETVCFGQHVT